MPFASEKQRKYLFKYKPNAAKALAADTFVEKPRKKALNEMRKKGYK